MLSDVDLSLSLSHKAFKSIRRFQRQRLYELEKIAFDNKSPTVILFEGWDAAGKGTTIQELTRRLDPRGFKVYAITAPRTHETRLPWLWRFWLKTPRYGEMAIFDRSWYRQVTIGRVQELPTKMDWSAVFKEINDFERLLAEDGVTFIKFWLHISKEEQLRRFIKLRQDPEDFWQVTEAYWERHRRYDDYLAAAQDMVTVTHTSHAPWFIVPATDVNYRNYMVSKTIINALEKSVGVSETKWADLAELEAAATG
jgi:polyphosphate kinase 2 (PPK2 family)